MNFVSLWVESRDSPVCTGLTLALRPQEAGRWPVTSLHACFSRVPPLVLTGRCPNDQAELLATGHNPAGGKTTRWPVSSSAVLGQFRDS